MSRSPLTNNKPPTQGVCLNWQHPVRLSHLDVTDKYFAHLHSKVQAKAFKKNLKNGFGRLFVLPSLLDSENQNSPVGRGKITCNAL